MCAIRRARSSALSGPQQQQRPEPSASPSWRQHSAIDVAHVLGALAFSCNSLSKDTFVDWSKGWVMDGLGVSGGLVQTARWPLRTPTRLERVSFRNQPEQCAQSCDTCHTLSCWPRLRRSSCFRALRADLAKLGQSGSRPQAERGTLVVSPVRPRRSSPHVVRLSGDRLTLVGFQVLLACLLARLKLARVRRACRLWWRCRPQLIATHTRSERGSLHHRKP